MERTSNAIEEKIFYRYFPSTQNNKDNWHWASLVWIAFHPWSVHEDLS